VGHGRESQLHESYVRVEKVGVTARYESSKRMSEGDKYKQKKTKTKELKATKTSFSRWVNKIKCGTSRQENFYSVLGRSEPSSQIKIWKNLKCILLSERSQSEKLI
jgi:hypothetical protein